MFPFKNIQKNIKNSKNRPLNYYTYFFLEKLIMIRVICVRTCFRPALVTTNNFYFIFVIIIYQVVVNERHSVACIEVIVDFRPFESIYFLLESCCTKPRHMKRNVRDLVYWTSTCDGGATGDDCSWTCRRGVGYRPKCLYSYTSSYRYVISTNSRNTSYFTLIHNLKKN